MNIYDTLRFREISVRVLSMLYLVLKSCEGDQLFYTSDHYANRTFGLNPLEWSGMEEHLESTTMCAMYCIRHSCQSFVYFPEMKRCEGYSTVFISPSLGQQETGIRAHYFVAKNYKICPSSYEYAEDLDLCYKYYEVGATWSNANGTCYNDGGYLFKMNTSDKHDFLMTKFNGYKFPEATMEVIWIQGNRDENYLWWYDDGSRVDAGYTAWVQGIINQPSNGENETVMVAFPKQNMGMMDADVYYYDKRPQPFLCEVPLET